MAYTEKNLSGFQIEITDPDTGESVKGPRSSRAKMKERLAAKVAKGAKIRKKLGTVTEKHKGEGEGKSPSEFTSAEPTNLVSETEKLGATPKQYTRKKKGEKKEKKYTLAQLAKRPDLREKVGKKVVKKGGAEMKGYGKDSGEPGFFDSMKESWDEIWRKEQPSGEAIEGVVEKENIPERYPPGAPREHEIGPEGEKIAEEYEQQFLSDEALK